MALDEDKIIPIIRTIDVNKFSSFSLKILVGQLKRDIDTQRISREECKEKFEKYIKEYGHLPALQQDLETFFHIKL